MEHKFNVVEVVALLEHDIISIPEARATLGFAVPETEPKVETEPIV